MAGDAPSALRSSRLGSSRGLGRSGGARRRARASLRFSRLRTAHDTTMRDIVSASWDDDVPSERRRESDGGSLDIALGFCALSASAADFATASRLSVPMLRQTKLGKRWSVDVLAVVHNAVRAEVAALYDILTCMLLGSEVNRGTVAELRAFFAWFSTFEAFVVTALKAEEEVLYPWLEQWGRIEGALSTGSRISTKGGIIRGVRDTSACATLLGLHHVPAAVVMHQPNYYDALHVGFAAPVSTGGGEVVAVGCEAPENAGKKVCKDVLDAVVGHVAKFTSAIAGYFREQEDALPTIIEGLYDAEDVRSSAVDRRTVRAIWKSGRKDEATLILIKGMGEDRAMARAWTQRNLRRIDRLSLPLWRRRYVSGRGAVVERFRERKKRNEQLLALHGHPLVRPVENCQEVAVNTRSLPYPISSDRVFRTRSER